MEPLDRDSARRAVDQPVNGRSGISEETYQLLLECDAREALREFDLPHVVMCVDPETGSMSIEGPFAEGLTACWAAEQDSAADRRTGAGLLYLVLPLLPPRDRS